MKTKALLLIVAAGMIAATSCYKYPSRTDYLTETDVVVTLYDVNTNFNHLKTYSIPDSIGVITDDDTVATQVANDTTRAVLDRIIHNMTQRGFTKVDTTDNPDMAINVVAIKALNTVNYYPGYWWGYPGYYPPGYWGWYDWNYYYPWYPVYQYQYEVGTIIIDVVDLKHTNPNGKTLTIVFHAYIRGLLNGRHTLNQILGDIDQAYIQTPQFVTN